MEFEIAPAETRLDRELALDLRRTVLCGELHWQHGNAAELEAQPQQVLLACLGPKPVGTGRVHRSQHGWILDGLAVLPAFRHKGLGRRLLAELEEFAAGQGAKVVYTWAPAQERAWFEGGGYAEALQGEARPGFLALEKKLS